jgi:hypothetical protein
MLALLKFLHRLIIPACSRQMVGGQACGSSLIRRNINDAPTVQLARLN